MKKWLSDLDGVDVVRLAVAHFVGVVVGLLLGVAVLDGVLEIQAPDVTVRLASECEERE